MKRGNLSMDIPVVKTSITLRIYLANYLVTIPLFIAMLLTDGGDKSYSLVEDIMWWGFVSFIFFVFILMPIWNRIWGSASMKFRIDSTGVTYIKRRTSYHIEWGDVQYIIFYPDRLGRITKNCFICFVSDKVPPILTGYRDFKEGAFGVQWRKGLEETIKEYTDKPIQGIEYLPGRKSKERR